MKVKFPEPVAQLIDYSFKIEDKFFTGSKLEELINGLKKDFGNIVDKLDDTISIVSYELIFQRADNYENLGFMSGGFDLSVKEGREYALPDFKRGYKETFKSILEKTKNAPYPLNIEISITGFGDKVTHEIDVKDLELKGNRRRD